MTGARPVPVNPKSNFMGFTVHLIWFLHHKISLQIPKMGELVAFRNFVRKIPKDTSVDEASIEAIVKKAGYQIRYVPEAVVFNKGPDKVRDYIRQRRRIAAGHRHLRRKANYKVSTSNTMMILKAIVKQNQRTIKESLWTLLAIGLEVIVRILGHFDYLFRKNKHTIWDIASSTKKLI
jgi:biofilm PGA synthesis N-glycosyltransferase PgaC